MSFNYYVYCETCRNYEVATNHYDLRPNFFGVLKFLVEHHDTCIKGMIAGEGKGFKFINEHELYQKPYYLGEIPEFKPRVEAFDDIDLITINYTSRYCLDVSEKLKDGSSFIDTITKLKEDIISLRNLVNANYVDFANYAQTAPKGSEQWTEERLRALELQMQELKNFINYSEMVNKMVEIKLDKL